MKIKKVNIFWFFLLAALSPMALAPIAASPAPHLLQLQLRYPGGVEELPTRLFVRLTPMSEGAEERQLELDLVEGELPSLELPTAGEWEVCIWAAGFWSECARTVIREAEVGTVLLPMELWVSGRVTGTFHHPREETGEGDPEEPSLPESMQLHFAPPDRYLERIQVPSGSSPPSEGGAAEGEEPEPRLRVPIPESESPCRIEAPDEEGEEARWRCFLPAGVAHLQLRPAGHVPAYHWDISVPPGQEVDLGPLVLRRGSSVVGFVAVEGGDLDPATCTVSLVPSAVGQEDRRGAQRLSEQRPRSTVGPRGAFQITGVPPGSYLVQAEQPGFAPGRMGPIEVWENAETVIQEPVIVRPPLTVDVGIVPAADWTGRRWTVALWPTSGFGGRIDLSPRIEKEADAAGRVAFAGIAPGVYTMQVFDSSGQSFHFDQIVRLETPEDASLAIEIPMVRLEGRVRLGEEPLQATLWFGGRRGAQRAELVADTEGRFVGVLPRGGEWSVELEASEPTISTSLRVDVEPDGDGNAEIEIELPDTRVFGNVVGVSGQRAVGARVALQSDGLGSTAVTDEDGAFELRGFDPGAVSIKAMQRAGGATLDSDTQFFRVAEDAVVGPLRLQLRSVETLHGRVLSPAGVPLTGAVVQVSAHRPMTTAFHSAARTAADGTFEVQVREGTEVLQAVVMAPGHALTVLEAIPESPLELRPEAVGGTLVVQGHQELKGSGLRLVIFQGDLSISIPTLRSWATSHGVQPDEEDFVLSLPSLAPGPYRACLASLRELTAAVLETGAYSGGLAYCDEGFLTAGGELFLKVRLPPVNASRRKP